MSKYLNLLEDKEFFYPVSGKPVSGSPGDWV